MTNIRSLLVVLVFSLFSAFAMAGDYVNINTADEATLQTELVGVGAEKARAIIKYRQDHGPFTSVEDLALVKGIAQKTIDKNRDKLTVNEVTE